MLPNVFGFLTNSKWYCSVTSLVLKSLHNALISQWAETVYVDVVILNQMAMWITAQQNASGAFIETSRHYYDRSFWVHI